MGALDLTSLPPLILAVATAVGLARLLELFVTRRKVRGEGVKVEVDAAQIISSELRAWAKEANDRARAAEEREIRLSGRVDEVIAQQQQTAEALARLETSVSRCRGGPPCPVRLASPPWPPPDPGKGANDDLRR